MGKICSETILIVFTFVAYKRLFIYLNNSLKNLTRFKNINL